MNAAQPAQPDAQVRDTLFEPLTQLRRRMRLYVALEGTVRLALVLLAVCAAQLGIDRGLRMTIDQRVVFNVVITVIWAVVALRYLVRPLRRWLPDHVLASFVDRRHPELNDQLATAIQFAQGRAGAAESNSPALMRSVVREACQAAGRLSFASVLNHRRARRRTAELIGLAGVVVALFVVIPETMQTWFARNWLVRDVPWPQATTITPLGFDEQTGRRRFPRGDELVIEAGNEGRVPKSAALHWRTQTGRKGRVPMTRVGEIRWVASLGLLDEHVSFRIVGGDERTREYTVLAIDRPRILRTTARVTPPSYTGLAPLALEQQTVLEVLSGSHLEIEARLNHPVAQARFVGAKGEVGRCDLAGDAQVRLAWDDPHSGSYTFELTDRDGWENRRPVRFTLKVAPDLPPDVSLQAARVGESITPRAELSLAINIEDEYGVSQVGFFVQRNDDPPAPIAPQGFSPGQRRFETEFVYPAATANVEPGDRLRLWAEARDLDPAGPNVGKSDPVELRVLSATDLLAELAQRELELRREFERLISAQRGLNDALSRLLPTLPAGAAAPVSEAQQLAGLARRQSAHATRTLAIRSGFEQILDEMQTNKVGRAADERRIGERVADPLGEMGGSAMPAASAGIAALRQESNAQRAEALSEQEALIARQMRGILANMLEWEGFREVLALMAEIVEQQAELRGETLKSLENELDAILDPGEPVEDAPEQPPKP